MQRFDRPSYFFRQALLCVGLMLMPATFGQQAAVACSVHAAGGELPKLAQTAWEGGGIEGELAALALREAGPAGVAALFAVIDAANPSDTEMVASVQPNARLDQICGQYLCGASRLYWHTDLDAAIREAIPQDRPILSLRLLGRLDSEHSCANSRFFRTLLYPDPAVADLLRERFVLHWESVRSVPTVTLHSGDGRELERPIGGNSVHLVLDSYGRLVDALPGLYAPPVFRTALEAAADEAIRLEALPAGQRAVQLQLYHQQRVFALAAEFERDHLAVAGESAGRDGTTAGEAGGPSVARGGPLERGGMAMYKSIVELPVLAAMGTLEPDHPWPELAPVYREAARLSPPSRDLVIRQLGSADEATSTVALERIESNLALDTVLNRYALEPAVHGLLAPLGNVEVQSLRHITERIYTEVFRTPLDDPWLGMAPADVYAAVSVDVQP